MSENALRVKDLFDDHQSPLTETRICELLKEDDVSELLTDLVENKILQKHDFADDLVLFWPTNWYSNEATTESSSQNEKSPEKEEESKPGPMAPPPQKVNHLSTPSSSLKARLARRKRPTTPSSSPSSSSLSSPSSTSSSPSSSPSSSTSSSPSSSPSSSSTNTTTSSSNITETTLKTPTKGNLKNIPQSSFITPSPKRRKTTLSPKSEVADINSLLKEKNRLETILKDKEDLLKKKQGTQETKPTGKDNKEKGKTKQTIVNDDKQLDALILKWREGCQQMLIDLQQTTKNSADRNNNNNLSLGQMMDMFQFERSLFPDYHEDSDCFG